MPEIKDGLYFKDILDSAHTQAIHDKMIPSDDSLWRKFAREYSKNFSTPLHLVLDMDPEFVMLQLYEQRYDDLDMDEPENIEFLNRVLRMIKDPSYVQEEEEELEDFVTMAEEQEKERLAKGKPIHPGMKVRNNLEALETQLPIPADLPKQGFVDFSKLDLPEDT